MNGGNAPGRAAIGAVSVSGCSAHAIVGKPRCTKLPNRQNAMTPRIGDVSRPFIRANIRAGVVAKFRQAGRSSKHVWKSCVRIRDKAAFLRHTSPAMQTFRKIFVLAAFTLALGACAKSEAPPPQASAEPAVAPKTAVEPKAASAAEAIKPLTQKKFGQPVTETKATTLTDLAKEPAKFSDQTVRTEGVVSAVCKSMGCWMEIADSSGQAHIKMAGHSFFVPREASGHRAVIQGKVMPAAAEKEGVCGADDGCGQGASAKMAKVEIEATGIEFVD